MKLFRLSVFTSALSLVVFAQTAHAAAFQLYELGTPVLGTAAVGQTVVNDASAAYFNPAAMVFNPGSQFMLGSQVMVPKIQFEKNTDNTISGNDGGSAGMLTPGMDVFLSYQYSPCLKFGFAVTSPYGGSLNYNDGWVGRFVVQDALFYTINVNPSVAYRFNDWLSAAAGVSLEYMSLTQTTALPFEQDVDGQIDVKTSNYAPGFNLGVMMAPSPATRLGIAYRSKITHHLHGDLTFLRIRETPNTSLKMVMPQNIMASLSQQVSNSFTLLAELGWSNWSSMQDTVLNVANLSAVTPRNWSNTYRAGLGGQFSVSPAVILQAGASYDSSPTSTSKRLPDLPMDRQVRLGVGVLYSIIKPIQLGFSYEYFNLGQGDINNASSNGVLAGHYAHNYVNTVQASMNVAL